MLNLVDCCCFFASFLLSKFIVSPYSQAASAFLFNVGLFSVLSCMFLSHIILGTVLGKGITNGKP